MITFFIPFYNEARRGNIDLFLLELSKFINKKINQNNYFILINDGSTDKTKIIIEEFVKKFNKKKIIFISNKTNKGVGFSFRKALEVCKTEFMIPIPADNDIPLMDFSKYTNQNIDFIMFFPINTEKYSKHRYLLTMLFRTIYCYFFDVRVSYIQAASMYKCSILKKINFNANRMGFWPEINIKMLKLDIKYSEIPIKYRNKAVIDRTVSLKNFIDTIYSFISLFYEIKFKNKKKYKFQAKKIYI